MFDTGFFGEGQTVCALVPLRKARKNDVPEMRNLFSFIFSTFLDRVLGTNVGEVSFPIDLSFVLCVIRSFSQRKDSCCHRFVCGSGDAEKCSL